MSDKSYMQQYRANNPNYVEAERVRSRAKNRAVAVLKARHRSEYYTLYTEELKKAEDEMRALKGDNNGA